MKVIPHWTFPSVSDRNDVAKAWGEGIGITDDLRARRHAYDYAWRRVVMNDHSGNSPLDPERKWFEPIDVAAAEGMWRKFFGGRYPEAKTQAGEPRSGAPRRAAVSVGYSPADAAAAIGDHERAARFRAQDRERAELVARIPDGGWEARCSEAIAYVECCASQMRANVRGMEDRTAAVKGDRGALRRVQQELGTSARENASQIAEEGQGEQEAPPAATLVAPKPSLGLGDLDARGG